MTNVLCGLIGLLLVVTVQALVSSGCYAASPLAIAEPGPFKQLSPMQEYLFSGVAGPLEPTALPRFVPSRVQHARNPQALAIWLTNKTSGSEAWPALVYGLKAQGIPVIVTRRESTALRHKMLIAYPGLHGLTYLQGQLLINYSRDGGTVLSFGQVPYWAKLMAGVEVSTTGRTHANIEFSKATFFTRRPVGLSCFWATSYAAIPEDQVVARFGDGAAAVVQSPTQRWYTFGLDLGGYADMAYNGRQSGLRCLGGLRGIAPVYADHYEDEVDTLFHWVRHLYRQAQPLAVTLSPVPDGKRLAVVLTHDIDYRFSFANALEYARWEHSQGISATYFVQTKYIRDWEDTNFFNYEAPGILRTLAAWGMEIGSHSVSHSPVFENMPEGSGLEAYPGYAPFVQSRTVTRGGTVLGELRVSQFLLNTLGHVSVVSFRPGYLLTPRTLPQDLQATGYKFAATTTADSVLSALPVQLHYSYGPQEALQVYDFPITFSDDTVPMMPRLAHAEKLALEIARQRGEFVLLLHPNVVGEKLQFEKAFVKAVRPYSWIGSIFQYGTFWRARSKVSVGCTLVGKGTARLTVTAPDAITGLTLDLPEGWYAKTGVAVQEQYGTVLVLAPLQGTLTLTLQQHP